VKRLFRRDSEDKLLFLLNYILLRKVAQSGRWKHLKIKHDDDAKKKFSGWCKIYTIISHIFGVFFFTMNIREISVHYPK
jgi:hypothetical protein